MPISYFYDISITGPLGFSGSIEKRLATCSQQPVTSFEAVRLTEDLSNVYPKKLSTDQQYLIEICNGINAGECSINLSIRNPGCLKHSQWLTKATRILKLYVSIKIPSGKLQVLVMSIICVYAPMWFAIKSHSSGEVGARHFHQQVARSRYLSQEQMNITDPVLHRN